MRRCVSLSSIFTAALPATFAVAQSITFSPASPKAGDSVSVQFSEPFDCGAPVPKLSARVADSFVFDSLFPSGIVNRPFIPSPPPKTSDFSVVLGQLPAGRYEVRWQMHVHDANGGLRLVSDSSAPLVVPASAVAPRPTPALSAASLLALAIGCASLALLHRRNGRRRIADTAAD